MAGLRGLKKRRRIQIVSVAAAMLALSTALIGYAMRDGISYFRSPSQILESAPAPNEVFRIGGLVEMGSLERGHDGRIAFTVTDGAAAVPVAYVGALPDLFAEGQGMIGLGRYVDDVFHADEILAKHDETYMPREVADALKEQGVYRDPDG